MDNSIASFIDMSQPGHFLLVFIAMWIVTLFMISMIGGWWSLAKYYRGKVRLPERNFHFQSAKMRFLTGYNHVLTFSVGEEGISMSPFILFRIGHPSLFFPWEDITAKNEKIFSFDIVTLTLKKSPGISIRIRPALSNRIAEASYGKWSGCFAE